MATMGTNIIMGSLDPQESQLYIDTQIMQFQECLGTPACDYHKVGMSVKGRLMGTHRTHFHSQILRSEVNAPL